MIELGRLKIYNNQTIISARMKMRLVSHKLGFSEITATRMESALSELFRAAARTDNTVSALVSLAENNKKLGISIVIEPVSEQIGYASAGSVFDCASIPKGKRALPPHSVQKIQ
jgi:hypothetical protein